MGPFPIAQMPLCSLWTKELQNVVLFAFQHAYSSVALNQRQRKEQARSKILGVNKITEVSPHVAAFKTPTSGREAKGQVSGKKRKQPRVTVPMQHMSLIFPG